MPAALAGVAAADVQPAVRRLGDEAGPALGRAGVAGLRVPADAVGKARVVRQKRLHVLDGDLAPALLHESAQALQASNRVRGGGRVGCLGAVIRV